MKCTVCGEIGHNKRSHSSKENGESTHKRKGKKKSTTAGDGARKRKEPPVKGKTKKRSKSGPTEEDHPACSNLILPLSTIDLPRHYSQGQILLTLFTQFY